MIPDEELIELWSKAIASRYGVAVQTSDRKYLQRRLYAARNEMQNDELNRLVIMLPPKPDELWITWRERQ